MTDVYRQAVDGLRQSVMDHVFEKAAKGTPMVAGVVLKVCPTCGRLIEPETGGAVDHVVRAQVGDLISGLAEKLRK